MCRVSLMCMALGLTFGCSSSDPLAMANVSRGIDGGAGSMASSSAEPEPPAERTDGGVVGPGSVGACQCQGNASCRDDAWAFLGELQKPRMLDRHFVGSECVARDPAAEHRCCFARPSVCLCYYAFGASNQRVFENALVLGNRTTCDIGGRGLDCLYGCGEFAGCDPADASSCDAACTDVAARIERDEAKSFDVELRTATCSTDSCLCRTVFRIDDRCYASTSPFAHAYDCSMSDEAILAASAAPVLPSREATKLEFDDAGALACEGR